MKDHSYTEVAFPTPTVTLKPDQEKVLDEFSSLERKQFDTGKKCACLFGHIYTGFGKSITAAMYAVKRKLPILIIINSDPVRQGWYNTFKDMFGVTPRLASGAELGKHDVCILSIQLAVLHKFGRDAYSHYGTIICDEADTLCTQLAVNELVDMTPKYFLGLTATVRRNDGLDKVLDIFWGARKDWVVRLKEFSESCSLDLHIIHTPHVVQNIYDRGGSLNWMSMADYVANIPERNMFIRNLALLHFNDKILVLCKRKEHVQTLTDMWRAVGADVATYYDTAKTYYDAHILVATVSKAGRGYDDKQVSAAFDGRRFNVLILVMTMKDADQALGRGLRGDYLHCYLLVDQNQTMLSHAEKMKSINLKRGARILEDHI